MAFISKKRALWLMAAVFGLIGLLVWPFMVGGPRMQAFCESVPLGWLQDQLRAAVSNEGYRLMLSQDGTGLVLEARSFGRFICEVKFQQGRVVAKRYVFND